MMASISIALANAGGLSVWSSGIRHYAVLRGICIQREGG